MSFKVTPQTLAEVPIFFVFVVIFNYYKKITHLFFSILTISWSFFFYLLDFCFCQCFSYVSSDLVWVFTLVHHAHLFSLDCVWFPFQLSVPCLSTSGRVAWTLMILLLHSRSLHRWMKDILLPLCRPRTIEHYMRWWSVCEMWLH